jgi:hypothetical protein
VERGAIILRRHTSAILRVHASIMRMEGRRGVLLGLLALAGCRGEREMTGEVVRAWRFVGPEDDANRPTAKTAGWSHFEGPLEPVFSGMVGSEQPLDALYRGLGNVVTRIELRGEVQRAADQLVARSQRLLWSTDAAAALMAFARAEALSVAPLWNAPEPVLRYLQTRDPALVDQAFDLAFSNGSEAALAAMMAMAPDSDERAWQNADTALSHAIEARAAVRVDPASEAALTSDWDMAINAERARVNARLSEHLEACKSRRC